MIEMGHHVNCTEIMMDDPGIVVNESSSASPPFQNSLTTTHHRPARSGVMVHHKRKRSLARSGRIWSNVKAGRVCHHILGEVGAHCGIASCLVQWTATCAYVACP